MEEEKICRGQKMLTPGASAEVHRGWGWPVVDADISPEKTSELPHSELIFICSLRTTLADWAS